MSNYEETPSRGPREGYERSERPERSDRWERGDRGGRRPMRSQRQPCDCHDIDYKNIELLQRWITDRGKILPARKTGLCAKCQRRFAMAVKRARHMALLPYVGSLPRLRSEA